MIKLKKTSGFTFIELIIYCGLFSILILVLSEIFLSALEVQLESAATSTVASDGQYITTRLLYDLPRASSIVSPPLGVAGGELQLLIDGDTYKYSLIENSLNLTIGGQADQLNSYQTKVSDLTFKHLGNGSGKDDTIQVDFTLTSDVVRDSGPETKTFQTTIGQRPN